MSIVSKRHHSSMNKSSFFSEVDQTVVYTSKRNLLGKVKDSTIRFFLRYRDDNQYISSLELSHKETINLYKLLREQLEKDDYIDSNGNIKDK